MPIISHDAIKEGYVNTYGVKHDQFPPNKNMVMSNLFFGIVSQHLAGKIPVVIEATSQHQVWESRIGQIQELDHPFIVVCFIDGLVAAKRHLQRGLENPRREFFHGDKRITIYKETGVLHLQTITQHRTSPFLQSKSQQPGNTHHVLTTL